MCKCGTYIAYASALGKAYDAGTKKIGFDNVKSLAEVYAIDEADVKAMYEAGLTDGKSGSIRPTVRYDVADPRKVKNSDRDTLLAFADVFGRNIVVTDSLTVDKANNITQNKSIEESDTKGSQVNGMFYNNTIYINLSDDVTTPIGYTIMHELTHSLKKQFPSEYSAFAELYKQRWIEKNGQESFDNAIADKIALYEKNGAAFNKGRENAEALEEIICDQMGEVLHDENFINNVAKKRPDIARALLNSIRDILRKIRQLFAEYGGFPSKYNNAMLSQLDLLKEAEGLLTNAIKSAQEVRNEEILEEDGSSDVRLSINPEYEEELDKWVNEGMEGNPRFVVGSTGEILQALGAIDQDIYINGAKIRKILENHKEMSIDKIKAIAKDIERPVLVMSSKNKKGKNTRLTMFGKSRTGEGPVLVIFDLKPRENGVAVTDMQKVNSAYAKNEGPDGQTAEEFVRSSNVLFVNKKRITRLLQSLGFTRPSELPLNDSVGNISYIKRNVKIEGEKFTDVFKFSLPTEDSDQAKLTTNENPTSSDDIRFSLSSPVEETKDLIAVHNVEESNFIKTLDLGGFPMPSIAVTKAAIGHTKFGEISVLFNKDVIDPSNPKNKVYGADAWTPTFPSVEHELNENKAEEIYKRAINVGGLDFFNPVELAPSNIDYTLINYGKDGLIEKYKNDYGLKQMFLAESDISSVKIENKTVKEEMPESDKEIAKWYLENGKSLVASAKKNRKANLSPFLWRKEHRDEIENIYSRYLSEALSYTDEQIKQELSNTSFGAKYMPISFAIRYETNNGIITREEDGSQDAQVKIDELVNQEDYEKWLEELLDGIEGDSGVWNGKDPYTSSGNRRSFKQLHYPVTVDNIVSAMLNQSDGDRNSESRFVGIKSVRAAVATDFKSIDGIKGASTKLRNIETEEYDKLKENLDNKLSSVMNDILKVSSGQDNLFIALDSLGLAIEEACSTPSISNIKKVLNGYNWKVTDAQAKEIQSIINGVIDMPVNMFEAKPQRVVSFNEIEKVVLPINSSADLKNKLDDIDVEYLEYDGTDEDRKAKVNEVADNEDLRFSITDSHGNEIVPDKAFRTFYEKLADAKKQNEPIKSHDGLFIISIGENDGINNILVYTKGRGFNPAIERIVTINFDDETILDAVRREVYDYEKRKRLYGEGDVIEGMFGQGILTTYESGSFVQNRSSGKSRSPRKRVWSFDTEGDERGRSAQKPLSEEIPTEDEVLKFSMDNDLYDPLLDGDISDEAKSRRVKVRCELLALVEDISRNETKLTHELILDEKTVKSRIKELVNEATANSDILPGERRYAFAEKNIVNANLKCYNSIINRCI